MIAAIRQYSVMARPIQKRSKPFSELTRREQKEAFIEVRNLIRRAEPVLGGRFYTHQYLDGSNGWLDLFFLGHQAPTFYNVTLETTRSAYRSAVTAAALHRSYCLASEREPSIFDTAVKDPRSGNYVSPSREPLVYSELEDLTRMAWINHEERLIADSGTIQVFEHWDLHTDYSYGIGLHITLDVETLTKEIINSFIERFLVTGAAYKNSNPQTFRYSDIANWAPDSNAVCEPWDYPSVP